MKKFVKATSCSFLKAFSKHSPLAQMDLTSFSKHCLGKPTIKHALITLSKFDKDDPDQHQMKILFGCGAKLGFRGGDKHVFLVLKTLTLELP